MVGEDLFGPMSIGDSQWTKLRRKCADDPFFFTKAVWCAHIVPPKENLLSRTCHEPMCLAICDDRIKRLLVEWPRRFVKTTCAEGGAVHSYVRAVINRKDPNDRTAFYSSTKEYAQRIWREIRWGFENNELFQFLFPELIPDFSNKTVWNEDEGIIPRTQHRKEPTFDTLGGGRATGRHYDTIFMDDMINELNYNSINEVQKVIEYYKLASNLIDDPDDRIVVIGNRWTMRDLNHYIHTEELETSILSASVWGPNLDGKYKCRNLPPEIMTKLEKVPAPSPFWIERFDEEALRKWQSSVKTRIWSAHALNNPVDPDSMEFKMEWVKSARVSQSPTGEWLIYYEDDDDTVPLSSTNLYMTWDPALDGKHSESYNGILVLSVDYKGRVCILREYCRRGIDPLEIVDIFLDYCKLYSGYLRAVGIEEVLFQKVLGSLVLQKAMERGIFVPYKRLKVPTRMNKDQRIRAWCGNYFQSGKVYVREGVTHFLDHYQHFGIEGAARDLMDCFAHATQLFITPPHPDQRKSAEEEERQEEISRGLTGYGSVLAR